MLRMPPKNLESNGGSARRFSNPNPAQSLPLAAGRAMASVRARDAPPPPVIRKAGRYTVFITPPRTPKPCEDSGSKSTSPEAEPVSSPGKVVLLPETTVRSPSPMALEVSSPIVSASPGKVVPLLEKVSPLPPPVQVPPLQVEKQAAKSSGSVFGFFWDAITRVQDAHSNLDECLADWFCLNQSKYQWALNDYYDYTGKKERGKGDKLKEIGRNGQSV
ncbi:proline-rich receptor-like protein kinase PERK10 [Zingiber officinale]|uniref:proline-rich receptor-like protein kinase PERK10 n=1 Tax=Zingiber officinale TaxID=94328 RepID=UPI001C4C064F|nr:proline-rich receptor-like protein kinase PERK10 [Zingiber officinale]